MGIYWIILIGTAVASWLVSSNFNNKAKKYSKIPLDNGMTGKEVAEKMLYDNDIHNVTVQVTTGTLSDNFNPANKTINLSKDVYYGNSVLAASVAAHETGHALQHAHAYGPLSMRSALVPVVTFASKWVTWIILGGLVLMGQAGNVLGRNVLLAGVALFAMTTVFSFITLPVEINASQRALKWLNSSGITNSSNHAAAVDSLKAAAYTYVVAALSSLASLLYYASIAFGRRN
ncbi:MAG: zinc metallopeptidase [Candidatus Symbiothrix sp.]|jgi:Zn-dependent membrane protease YugP|nr:zinc metallopeptidase [Candidatus Symbiothrix sp.]